MAKRVSSSAGKIPLQPADDYADEGMNLDDENETEDDADDNQSLTEILRAEVRDAEDFVDSDISPLRERAARYYQGALFGDEEDGRSQVVLTEVRDTINSMMPSLMRTFVGGEQVVEYAPTNPGTVEQAEQATDYVNYLLDADGNNRFELLYAAFKDALLKKLGVITWRWENYTQITEHDYTGLTLGQAQVMAIDPEVEILDKEVHVEDDPRLREAMADPNTQPAMIAQLAAMLEVRVDLKVRRTRQHGCLRVEAVPPEEFLISRWAKNQDTATLVGRRRYVKASDVVAMGVDEETVEEHSGRDSIFGFNNEALNRQLSPNIVSTASPDESQNDVLLYEVFLRADMDGDGIAELHYIRAIGADFEIILDEIVPEVDYALFAPNPEPHAIYGLSVADETMDLQDIKSHVLRNTLDSLASSIFPSLVIVENAVEVDDALNTEMGRVIRAKAPGMVQSLAEPFIGAQALGVLQYLDDIRASRTGMSKASQGLDPDVLQSTTKAAVANTLSAAQERMELVARSFAESGMKRLFRGILRTVTRHQDKARMVKLRGKWTEVDPREWDSDMEVVVNVALGRGDDAQRMQVLGAIAQKQEQAIQLLGPTNPLCGLDNLRNTYAEFTRIGGYKNATLFWKEIDPKQLAAQAAQQPKPQDNNAQLLAQVEMQKSKDQQQVKMLELQETKRKNDMDDDRERDKAETEAILKATDLLGKYGIQVDQAQISALTERDRHAMNLSAERDKHAMTLGANTQQQAIKTAADERLGMQQTDMQERLGQQKNELQNEVAMKAAQRAGASNAGAA